MKLLRTIRLDLSDTFIFPAAAEPGDWAISGASFFAGMALEDLEGKMLAAFRSGFLGLPSLGWSTLAQIVEVGVEERAAGIELAARAFLDRLEAPGLDAARAAATAEFDFAASLCDQPADILIAVHRRNHNGTIRETFRRLRPRPGARAGGVYAFLEAEGDDAPEETVDLAALARGAGR